MPHTTTIQKKTDYIFLTVAGAPVDFNEASDYADIVIDCFRRYSCHRILIDATDFHMNVDILGAIQLTEVLIEKGVPSMGLRVASVVRPEKKDSERMLETAMRNRTINYRIFDNMNEAQTWLTS